MKEFKQLLDNIHNAYRDYLNAVHAKIETYGNGVEIPIKNESGEPFIELVSNFNGELNETLHIDKVRYKTLDVSVPGSYQIHVCQIDGLAADRWTSWYEWYNHELKKIYENIDWG